MNLNMKKILAITCGLLIGSSANAQTYTLQQLKDSAIQHNASRRAATYDLEIARQQRKEAFTKFFPNISATGFWFNTSDGMAKMEINPSEYIPSNIMPVLQRVLPMDMLVALSNPVGLSLMKKGTLAAVTALQPIFAGGQIFNGNKLARIGEEVSLLQLQIAENEIDKKTEEYYWQIVTLTEKMKTIHAVESLLNSICKDVDVAVRAGVALHNDLLQVKLRMNDIEGQRLKLENAVGILKLTLSQHCRLKTSTFEVKTPEAGHLTLPPAVDGLQVEALPEYQLLQKQVDATNLQKKMAIGQHLPSVAVEASYNYHNLLDSDHTTGMIFATISIPISNWWGGAHEIKRKKLEQQKAIEQLENNAQMLKIRMQKAWNDVYEAYQQMEIAQKGIEQAEENLRQNQNFYKAGTAKMSDLLEAQMLFQQACDRHTDAFANYQNKLLEYKQAIGNN